MQNESGLIELGYISGFYGVKGWVKVYSNTRPKENILQYQPWMVKLPGQGWTEIEILEGRLQGKGIVAHLAGYNDRNQALPLIKAKLAIKEDQLPGCDEGEYYWRDLIGFEVKNQQQTSLGTVKGVLETGAHDVMVVKSPESKEILIPWVHDVFIFNVDINLKEIIVDWIEEDE